MVSAEAVPLPGQVPVVRPWPGWASSQLQREEPEGLSSLGSHHSLCTRHTRPCKGLKPNRLLPDPPLGGCLQRLLLQLGALHPREPQGPVSPPSGFCSNVTFPTSPILTLTSHLKSQPLTLSARSQTQKLTSCVIPFIGNTQNRKTHRKQTGGCRSREEGELGDDRLMGTGLSLGSWKDFGP